jgi:hypothetical protein
MTAAASANMDPASPGPCPASRPTAPPVPVDWAESLDDEGRRGLLVLLAAGPVDDVDGRGVPWGGKKRKKRGSVSQREAGKVGMDGWMDGWVEEKG